MNYYKYCIKNYANFSGRARRKEYWIFLLCNLIIFTILGFLAEFINTFTSTNEGFLLIGIYGLFIITPHLACAVRRLHDVNKSGTYWFVRFIPLIGPIWLLILFLENSWEGQNKYGMNPKKMDTSELENIGKE
ncbi:MULTISPECIES: DUF805 domain-containing protein [Polaribacter]|uniref:DUF805 domain-containing protein n=1 Tax=Polaribacter marinaquae TaxID=1642819 RepID=A0ABZ2TSQ0_9FLAO